jgi:hypothetical protein
MIDTLQFNSFNNMKKFCSVKFSQILTACLYQAPDTPSKNHFFGVFNGIKLSDRLFQLVTTTEVGVATLFLNLVVTNKVKVGCYIL